MLDRSLRVAVLQHQLIRDRLQAAEPCLDERTLADTLEGLTDLNEIISAVVRAALEDEALASGLKARVSAMEERLTRLHERAVHRRQIARDAMVESGVTKIVAPDFTISVRTGNAGLVVLNEAVIPAEFWEPRDPRLNRQALLGQLKQGASVAGVSLSNPEPVLSVRTK